MLDPPLPILDAEIRAAAQAVRRARGELRLEGAADDPLAERRQVSSRYMFLELADEKDPVAPSARAWVAGSRWSGSSGATPRASAPPGTRARCAPTSWRPAS